MATRWEQERPSSGPVVTGFAGNGFKVDGTLYAGGVLLTPVAAEAWDAPAIGALTPEHVEALIELQPTPEFLLLGTGATLSRPTAAFVRALEAREVGLEPMDSRAAARAWAVLRAEDRWIVAALMPI